MKGQKAVVVIIIAMVLTAGIGFFANFEKKDTTRTEYSLIGNMDAFFSANSSPTPQSELFNSTYNITGWSGDIDTTDTVLPAGRTNQYVFKEESTDYKSFEFSYNYGMHAYTLSGHYTGDVDDLITWPNYLFKTSLSDSESVYMFSGTIIPISPAPVAGDYYTRDPISGDLTYYSDPNGGYGQTTYYDGNTFNVNKTLTVTFNGTDYSSTGFFITDLNDLINNNPDWGVFADGSLAYEDDYSPMIYDTEGQAIAKENEYRTAYPNKVWSHRQISVSDYSSNARIYIKEGNVAFVGSYEYNYNWSHTESGSNRTVTGSLDYSGLVNNNVAYLRYNPNTQHWIAFSEDDERLWDSDKVGIYSTDGTMSFKLDVQQYYIIPAVYFDPTRYMGIVGTAEWSNWEKNHSLVNTEVTFLWKGTGVVQINANGPVLNIIQNGSTYSIRTDSGTVVPLGTYKGLEITLRSESPTVYIRGILNEQVNADDIPNTYDYLPATIGYEVGLYDQNTSDEVVPVVPQYIYKLIFSSLDGYAYIQNTYILTDPNNLLWSDINIDMGDYFSDYADRMRVLLQGFVRYGDQVTINGQDYEVTDSTITVTVTEVISDATDDSPAVTRTYDVTFNLNGLAIDYYQGHVHLIQTNGRAEADLGEISDYILKMHGTWFFSSSLSTIAVLNTKENVWNPGWDMDMITTALLFAGIVIGLFVIMMMRFREMLDWEDIIILIFAIFVPIVVVIA